MESPSPSFRAHAWYCNKDNSVFVKNRKGALLRRYNESVEPMIDLSLEFAGHSDQGVLLSA